MEEAKPKVGSWTNEAVHSWSVRTYVQNTLGYAYKLCRESKIGMLKI